MTPLAPERVVIVGTGYVGLVTGACLASIGNDVTCTDVDPKRVSALTRGSVPFYEPGLDDVIGRAVKAGRLAFAHASEPALESATVVFIAVGTPQAADGTADLSFVEAASADVAKRAPRGVVVVTRSTVPPGTGDRLAQRAREQGRADIEFVSAPEFLAEGTAVKDFLEPSRLVFGGSPEATRRVAALFSGIPESAPRILTDRRTAELSKYAANTFLAARVSLINEFANLADALGADVATVSRVVGLDPRVGPLFLRPGIGYGGSCFPKDVKAVLAVARAQGVDMRVAQAADRTNAEQWRAVLRKSLRLLDDAPRGKKVAVLGIAFKPGTDDTRMAPGTALMGALLDEGATVVAHDPKATLDAALAQRGAQQAKTALEAIHGADLVVLVTEWPEYRALPWHDARAAMRAPRLVDGRNHLDLPALRSLGFTAEGVGKP